MGSLPHISELIAHFCCEFIKNASLINSKQNTSTAAKSLG